MKLRSTVHRPQTTSPCGRQTNRPSGSSIGGWIPNGNGMIVQIRVFCCHESHRGNRTREPAENGEVPRKICDRKDRVLKAPRYYILPPRPPPVISNFLSTISPASLQVNATGRLSRKCVNMYNHTAIVMFPWPCPR